MSEASSLGFLGLAPVVLGTKLHASNLGIRAGTLPVILVNQVGDVPVSVHLHLRLINVLW